MEDESLFCCSSSILPTSRSVSLSLHCSFLETLSSRCHDYRSPQTQSNPWGRYRITLRKLQLTPFRVFSDPGAGYALVALRAS